MFEPCFDDIYQGSLFDIKVNFP